MIFNSLDSVKEMMVETDRVKWVVEDAEKNAMKTFNPEAATTPDDSFVTLQLYLGTLRGNGYVVVKIYSRDYKPNSGGELKKMVRAFNIPIGNYAMQQGGLGGFGQQQQPGSDTLTRLEVMIAEMKKDKEIDKLQRELDEAKKAVKQKTNFFESAIKGIGKELTIELLKQQGYTIEGLPTDDEDEIVVRKKKAIAAPATTEEKKPVTEAEVLTDRDIVIKTGKATSEIMNNLAGYGITKSDVATTFAELAELSKTNPLKFKEVLTQLGVKNE